MSEYFGPSSKKGRGMARRSLDLIEAMHAFAEAAHPITGRGIGYKLFTACMIPSMDKPSMQGVYRLLKEARERGMIPWEWIVDETRELEKAATWDNPADFVNTVSKAYRREFWNQQPVRVEVWSEKGTVRGVLAPVLEKYGVGFRVMHGFGSATDIHNVADDDDRRPLIVLYVGDFDPSGMCMSEHDLPKRLDKYGGSHVKFMRIGILRDDLRRLSTFPAADKKGDKRYEWFVRNFGPLCCELDAMDPNDLRTRVETAIKGNIEPDAWARCDRVEQAERESLRSVLDQWTAGG